MTEKSMTENVWRIPASLMLALSALVFTPLTWASSDSLLVNVTGTITETTCTVNNNQSVTVEFGTVQTSDLSSAEASLPVTVSCDETPTDTLYLTLSGDASSFNTSALKTDVTGLGVKFMNPANTQIALNQAMVATLWSGSSEQTGSFNLTAKLVQQDGVTLAGGEFNASATLVVSMS